MNTQKCIRSLTIVAALAVSLFASSAQAYFEICNETGETIFVMFVVPENTCASKWRWSLSLSPVGRCTTLYTGNAKGKKMYYRAWSQDSASGREWGDEVDMWIPRQSDDGYNCMPQIGCRLSEGSNAICPGGSVYRMEEITVGYPNTQINLH